MKNREYWIKRAIQQDKKVQKDLKKLEKQLKKEFVEVSKEIKKELAYFYSNNSNITEYEKYRLESTLIALNKVLDNLYHNEEEMINNSLIETYIDIYEDNIRTLGVETSFHTINEDLIREVIKTNWSGLTFSEIIWDKHLPQMKNDLKQVLKVGLIRGDSLQDMARALNDKVNKGYSNALRLVHTETCWIQNKATINSYKDTDVKEYEFMAFLDKRTSAQCRELDGNIFNVNEAVAGVNIPPLHPRCRSCIIPVINNEESVDDSNKVDYNYDNEILSNKKWLESTFSTQKKFNKHIEKHIHEYNYISEKEYLNIARELLSAPLGNDVEGFISSEGWLFKYRKSTNDFAMGHPKGTISTLFKPELGYEYWLEQIKNFKIK